MPAPISVKLKSYEGPLDLLLDLIHENRIDITDIPVAEITEQYLDYLGEVRQLDLDIAGEFLAMAATLVLLKSKMLLPLEGLDQDEEGLDPRSELVAKLLEYQAFKQVAAQLGLLEDERAKIFSRDLQRLCLENLKPAEPVEIEAFPRDLSGLLTAFHEILKGLSKDTFHEVLEQGLTIEEKIEDIKGRLAREGRFEFRTLLKPPFTRNELAVTFLAMLELMRTCAVRVEQDRPFGEIWVEPFRPSEASHA